MAKITRKTLKVSDCHHGNITPYDVYTGEGENKKVEIAYKCDICKEFCKVLELLVEER